MVQAKTKGTEIELVELLTEPEKETVSKIKAIAQQLNGYFLEREDYVDLLFISRLAKQHVVSFGPPGTGKSYLIVSWNTHFTGSRNFSYQLNKFTVPEEIFGIFSLPKMKLEKYERVVTDKLPEAEIAYLDEVFNANTSVLNMLNEPMNERAFQGKNVPLETIQSATNFMPEEKTTVAFYDRFTWRIMVDYLHEARNFEKLMRLGKYAPSEFITKEEFASLQQKVDLVQVPAAVYAAISKMREMLRIQNIVPSDRRFLWALRGLKARALLNGRDSCTQDDLWILKYALWSDPKDVAIVESIIMKCIDPDAARIKEIFDQAVDVEKQLRPLDVDKDPKLFADVKEGLNKLTKIADAIAELRSSPIMIPRVRQVAETLERNVREMKENIKKQKLEG